MLFKTITLVMALLTATIATAVADQDSASPVYDTQHFVEEANDGLPNATSLDRALLAKRTSVAGVYICSGRNWSGNCAWSIASGGKCHNGNQLDRGSFGPDHGLVCEMYSTTNCGCEFNDCGGAPNGPTSIQYPGISTLVEWSDQYQDKGYYLNWMSYMCHWA